MPATIPAAIIDKRVRAADVVAQLADGMTIGIGGWGSRRKPMTLVRALCASPLRDLTIVSFGGPDVGLLCAAKKVRKLVYGFVSLDSIALDPHFRAARQRGELEAVELDEGMLQWGLYAAALRLPFLPTRAGLGSDVLTHQRDIKTVRSPYADRHGNQEELVAMPALVLDAALCHVNRADESGNAALDGPDPFFDELYLGAAARRFISCERIVPTTELSARGLPYLRISRMLVDGVVEAPRGAGFTDCAPDYGRDEAAQRAYAADASKFLAPVGDA
jgi:glutaconate CoA-transferase subunit A